MLGHLDTAIAFTGTMLVLSLVVTSLVQAAFSVANQRARNLRGALTRLIEQLGSEVAGLAEELANGPQVSMRLLKRSLYNASELDWHAALDEIAAKTAISDHHSDAREGVMAFHEKRPASFNAWLNEEQ